MFRPLKAILKERTKQYSFTDDVLVDEVLKIWNQSAKERLGPDFKDKARAFNFKKGVLLVKVIQPDLLKKLKIKEKQTIEKINKVLQRNFIGAQKLKKISYEIDIF